MSRGWPRRDGRRGPRFRPDRRGVAAIELAIVLPVYLLMFFGVMDMGWLMFKQVTLDRAVSLAARCAAVRKAGCLTTSDIQKFAASSAVGLKVDWTDFGVTYPSCGIQVQVSQVHKFFYAPGRLGSITLQASACMIRTDVAPV